MKRVAIDHTRSISPAVTALGLATLAFVLLPLPFIVLYALSRSNYALFSAQGFTLQWFQRFFENDRFMAALQNSLAVSVITTVVALIVAVPTAMVAVRHRFPGRDLLMTLISAPLLVPGVITGTAALSFVAQTGIGPGFWPIVVAMICFTLPLVLRPLVANLSGLDPDLEKAARNLGASPLAAFWRVTMPQLAPGLVAGGTFAFVEAMDNFSITVFLTNISTTTLPVEAYSYIRDIDDPTVAAMATVLILMSVGVVFAIEWLLGLDRFLDMS
jgi:putative spermidine/putrescine transport system permease protein